MGRRRPALGGDMAHSDAVGLQISFRRAIAFGPGKARLLEAVADAGSLMGAARLMDMSYKRAWTLIGELNAMFDTPLVALQTGGNHGGGAALTPLGSEVLARFRALEHGVRSAIEPDFTAFAALLAVGSVPAGDAASEDAGNAPPLPVVVPEEPDAN